MDDNDPRVDKYKALLDEWEADMAKLKAEAKQASASLRIECGKLVEELEEGIAAGRQKLAEFRDTPAEAKEALKKGMDQAWGETLAAWKALKSKLG